jgi:cysteinyl-tRNA synthetase
MPSPLRVYNTLTRKLEELAPADPARVTFYTCGPTVYDDAHIGNFRSFLAADTLRRFVESPLCTVRTKDGGTHRGPRQVVHVMNITDVGHMTDDAEGGESGEDRMAVAGKRLLEAKKSGKLPAGAAIDPGNPYDIARFYADRFLEDARTLGLKVAIEQQKDPSLMPRATASIPGMIEVIKTLITRGHAYAVGPAGAQTVYFHVPSFAPYGTLSGNSLDALSSGAGGRVNESNQAQKKHPADFLLWKADPSHIMKWDSPWGAGYPGWHIECTVMSAARLMGKGDGLDAVHQGLAHPTLHHALIDLHSGGEDNIFPHHESEIAQSSCAFCAEPETGTFASLWFHPRHLFVNGMKMSKSKGNFFTIRDLIAKGHEAASIRLELIRTHYRTQANFTEQGLADCARMIERWRKFWNPDAPAAGSHPVLEAFGAALTEDLNIAAAIAEVNKWTGSTASPAAADQGAMRVIDSVLGLMERPRGASTQTEIALYAPGVEPNPQVESKLAERRDARTRKDFATSDRIRDELAAMGYAIKDVAGGKVEVRRG